ncbi:putative agnoprotein [Squirrel monkey polyomavirus]|uniref:Squirrel monkey agnoprotein n=24 Tax=Squirrel monkey polyomavirus TaxID=452475 RepID=AGNO_POVSM|nr:putative agnoprotein [Squirrel monkey polyomavirus]A8Y986.1 RecName: Full=Squirrel monkey agnoprotein; AltName: Full=Agno [Squirrel monkey polyomavirus]QXP80947.1 agno [Squirrel monkey polyomavirus]QXP80953.1 agno [Squirrel monkey polyomavirus]CAO03079.1 putative agnoprotein [Squirrel monkey polyomavirus]
MARKLMARKTPPLVGLDTVQLRVETIWLTSQMDLFVLTDKGEPRITASRASASRVATFGMTSVWLKNSCF